ncbi:helix-turn-helix domain-containing protein [Cyanobium sp. Aljojuca 7D2]|uniref:MerR family transcriptional regulator n=1 Tax=Cyanobium sp. Aljojuca 7D2 TaxID=2823698 RepID=UPI0020CD6EAC|nr:helix-turn-helix domain-containing protein [Cyanobium sp. Aljojuca 7D2]MCP9891389.1 helix-turn-helix domain-containing protein [Cyanobium sp. Aljojuca 7D2]
MSTISPALLDDVTAVLRDAGRSDLVERLVASTEADMLTSKQAASLLGVASANTVKNWLEGGYFPGAFQTPGGHWRFPREEVEAVKMRMEDLRNRNRHGDLMPVGEDEDSVHPPLP